MQPIIDATDLVIFDCDGVLVDSEIISAEILLAELSALGVTIDVDYILQHFLGHSFSSTQRKLHENLGVSLPPGFKARYGENLLREFERRLKATRGIDSVLRRLNVDVCVATSSSPKRVQHALEIVGLDGFFGAHVFTASEVKDGKPAPDLFLHAAQKMGVAPDKCLVLEDSPAGITAGVAAGMSVLRYTGGSHLRSSDSKLSRRFSEVAVLDDWQDFYNMAPHLSKRDDFLE